MMEENDKGFKLALWRYGVISPLLHREADSLPSGEVLEQAALKRYIHPDGSHMALSPETLRKWLYRYRISGLPGLMGKERSDKGSYQIPQEISEKVYALRKEHPRWTVARITRELIRLEIWNGRKPSRSAIYRFVNAHHLGRDPHLEQKPNLRAFAFDHFGQLWIADFLHGPKLWDGKNKHKTFLHLILDDSSRYIVHGGFYLTESAESLVCDLVGAVRRFGIPRRLYTDNGAAYAGRHLKLLCARNGIDLIHTPPFIPQGRGKIERLFRTVRDQFLCDRFKTVTQMNQAFKEWVGRYHETLHSSLGCSPLQKRLQSESVCRPLAPSVDIEALFRMEKRCRVYNDGTIRLRTIRYEVDCLAGSRVTVYYMPWDKDAVYYGDDFKKARILDPGANARRFEK